MLADNQQGKCPCGCGAEVPNNRFYATPKCGRRANRRGVRMPIRHEIKRSTYRGKR